MNTSKSLVLVLSILIMVCSLPFNAAQLSGNEKDITKIEANNWWEDWERDANHNKIDDLIEDKNEEELFGIFINYDRHPDEEDVNRLSNFDVKYVYKYIDIICARNIKASDVRNIAKLPHVTMVKLEPLFYPNLDISSRAIKARESDEYSPNTASELGYTGEGISIAILDSGVDDGGWQPNQHHDFVDDLDDNSATNDASDRKRIAGVDFTQEVTILTPRDGSYDPDDTAGHGTHCAGIALGTGGIDKQYVGVAPQARLVDVKVIEDYGVGNTGDTMAGLEWCIEHMNEYNIKVLSLSLGGLTNSDGTDEESQLVNTAVEAGLVVVISIGNDGELPPKGDGVADNSNVVPRPGAADKAITVGSVYDEETVDRKDDTLSDFSFSGPRLDDGDDDPYDELKPDVVAYGEDIASAQANTASDEITFSGTSMACPHVAGVAALMLEANPNLPPDKVKEILRSSAEPRGSPSYPQLDPVYNTQYGWGIVDAYRAVSLAEGFVEVNINIDSPTTDDTVSGTVEISGTASTDKGPVSLVEVTIDDPTFQSRVLKAEGTDTWTVSWDTETWSNSYHTIYARATHGEYSAMAQIDVFVFNEGDGTGDSDGSGDTGPPTVDLMGIGKISVYALAAFGGIIAGVVALIVTGILLKRRKLTREMMVTLQSEQEYK